MNSIKSYARNEYNSSNTMKKKDTNGHILIADDEPLIRDMLQYSLESLNYRVSIANNGLEALYLMAERDFDVVLMDIRMPVLDGLEAIELIRKCEQGKHLSLTKHQELAQSLYSRINGARTPVVAITGNIDDREVLLKAGMDEFIAKPFNIRTLQNVLNEFCGELQADSPVLERRRHPRHIIVSDTITACNGINGHVVDISSSGLAIRYADHASIPEEWNVCLFNTVSNTLTPYLPLKLVRKEAVDVLSPSGVGTITIGAMFHNLDACQKSHIHQFIDSLS